jgi:formate-dependent nitrite reductase membrane component NrfD
VAGRRDPARIAELAYVLMGALVALAVILVAELGGRHANLDASRAADLITEGRYRSWFWGGVVVAGVLVPLALAALGTAGAAAAAVLALAGLAIYEDLWLRAGQAIPLS